MLELWFKEKRTLVDFRRGLLGPYFDGFAAYLQAKGYSRHTGCHLLAKCCQFNDYVLTQRVAGCEQLGQSHVEAFLSAYFAHLPKMAEGYLLSQRGFSSHTVLAYRDTWKLLLQFASRRQRKSCARLTLEDLKADTVRRFLDYLERERHNAVPTRNNRLAAIHSFFQFAAQTEPRCLAQCEAILAVRFKRHAQPVPEYLERQEVLKIFAEINCRTPLGQRDDALLRLLYNTGMRAQELVNLDVNHVRFSRPYHVRIFGKGRNYAKLVVMQRFSAETLR